jgi:multidrug efflux pump subunit AcrA (membrane-fusion protein)
MNKVKLLRVMLTAVITAGLVVLLSGCTSKSETASDLENQVVTVQHGDITVDIAAAGNLSLSLMEDLAFEMPGTVEEVLVEVGDSVEEGQVLAKLDTSEWEEQLTAKECDLLQAEVNLKQAEIALDKAENPYDEEDIEEAEEAVEDAEDQVDKIEDWLADAFKHSSSGEVRELQMQLDAAETNLDDAEDRLYEMLYERDEDDIEIKGIQVKIAEGRLENFMKAVEEALDASPEIIAPFDGFVTQVNVSGGDEVTKGTIAMQVADPTRFEAELLVSEMDIFQLELGGEATVQVDAISMLNLPAEVTYISPTATIQSGVVNYEVTVELESLETIRQQQQEAMQARQEEMQEMITSGEIPEQLQEAIEVGKITQEQAEEMVKQWQQGEGAATGSMPTLIPEDLELKEGLSVTISIVVEERNDVLLVPNQAVTYRGGETYVQVLSPDGIIEERLIQTGISDWQYTEVTEGLSEGEQVVVLQETTVTTPTTPEPGKPGGMMIPMPGKKPPR